MDFGEAIKEMKKGKRLSRKGWNGKEQYIIIGSNFSYQDEIGAIVNPYHEDIGNKAFIFVGTRGAQVGWLASQSDMLAEDWYIKE